ncbi:hypothetical protein Pelo_18227 [Pelomyxa schiedti]|nr:hypothetical protein Pelo_18227 [Pelomyxa schiedti]
MTQSKRRHCDPPRLPIGTNGSLLCMKRDEGTNVFIVTNILGSEPGIKPVQLVEEATGNVTYLSVTERTAQLSQLDRRIFLVSRIIGPRSAEVGVEFWDCNDSTKPLRVVHHNDICQWVARSGFFFRLHEATGPVDSNKRKCITVEDASSGRVLVSLNFQPDVLPWIQRVFTFFSS